MRRERHRTAARAMRRWENFKAARLGPINLGRWNLARHLDYKILSHSNDKNFSPHKSRLYDASSRRRPLAPTKSARTEIYSHGVRSHGTRPRQDPPASKSQSMRAAYEILKFHRPQSRAIPTLRLRPTQSPYLTQNSIPNARPTHRASLPLRKIPTLAQTAKRRSPHPHPECRVSKNTSRAIKNTQIATANPTSGANFYFTVR